MPRIALPLTLLAIMLVPMLRAAPAHAQASRAFVAAQGSDGNPCTFALPCRTFQRAHDAVAAGGEIDVLDPAGYGAVTISKSVSIQGHGFAGIATTGGVNGMTIAIAGVVVNLRGLLLDGAGVGHVGIGFYAGGAPGSVLNIQDCVIRNFANDGIQIAPSS